LAKIDKTLEKWEQASSEKWDTVEAVLKRKGFKQKGDSDGTHYSFIHPALSALIKKFPKQPQILAPYGPDGRIEVIRQGKRVPGYILRRIKEALFVIEEYVRLEKPNKELEEE